MKAPRTGRRVARAALRDLRVLLSESRGSLILFASVFACTSLLLRLVYVFPGTGQHPSLGNALYGALAMVFFETALPFAEQWYLQPLFLIVPLLDLAALATGVVRFSTALINKRERGQKWQVAMASTYSNHVVVCGIGKLGYRVVLELVKFGRDVVAVDADADGRFIEKVQGMNIPVVAGDARREENLIKAGVPRADSIIPCTGDELANLDIALDAREMNPGIKVVMRMFDQDLAARVEKGFGIHTAFSASALAAPLFAAAAMRVDTKYAFYVDDTLLHVSRVRIETASRLTGLTVGRLAQELGVKVVSHQRAGSTEGHPDAELGLEEGDTLTLIATMEELSRLAGLNGPPSAAR